MSSSKTFQQAVAVGLAMLAVMALMLVVPKYNYLPHGIVLPSKVARSATTMNDVNLYLAYPLAYESMGSLKVELHAIDFVNKTDDRIAIINKARELAAQVGANGLVFKLMFTGSDEGTALSMYYLKGEAIYTSIPSDLHPTFFNNTL